MKRKDFIHWSALGMGAALLPGFSFAGRNINPQDALAEILDAAEKKVLADIALNTAKSKGASYADIRIGRYLNQFILTRENRVQNVANTESFGAGIRVLVNGAWGFAASNKVTREDIAKTADRAVAVAKANAKINSEPVQLAPQQGYGEVNWKTPIQKNAFEIPVKEKVDLLLQVNGLAMQGGAKFHQFRPACGERAEIFRFH